MRDSRLWGPVPVISAMLMLLLGTSVSATGTVRIQQADNSVQTYSDVHIFLLDKQLMLTSKDNVSTIIIDGGTCTPQDALVHCVGGGLSLFQNGMTQRIPFQSASFYFNLTERPQSLSLSTMKVGARSVIFVAQTRKGTYITGKGRLDVLDLDRGSV